MLLKNRYLFYTFFFIAYSIFSQQFRDASVIAVKNQPPITFKTPATLYTALSLPQALSAKEVPIATIKVTYVVDNGNFIDVAIDIKIPATIKF